ncbi:hypothetical protein MNBD_GAMMA06-1179 [hydrothermal vent metagenome]|uniref:Uncharacterized protein n=1 Tax=hydrothermal vent metagenome TaxID=652676 RepID=A0A3B0X7C8_9ZZZZ
MFNLPLSLKAWGTASFYAVLKQEVCALDATLLPLQQGLKNSSYAISDKLSIIILESKDDAEKIHIKTGLLYNGIISGCSCSDDPTPIDETNEYCDVLFFINKKTAETKVKLID